MTDPTHCRKCGERIWWEESAQRKCWVSRHNGSWCVEETSHEPEEEDVSNDIEEIINRIERGARITRADKTLSGYVLEVDDWRSIRAALRRVVRPETAAVAVDVPDPEPADPRDSWSICTMQLFGRCDGRMQPWWGSDGHSGRERFYTCDRCGRTS